MSTFWLFKFFWYERAAMRERSVGVVHMRGHILREKRESTAQSRFIDVETRDLHILNAHLSYIIEVIKCQVIERSSIIL